MTENQLQAVPNPVDEAKAQSAELSQGRPDQHKTLIIVLTLITSIVTAIVAGLQADAGIRASNANRDSQYYAVLASGEIHRQGLQSNYETATMTEYLRLSQESLVMQIAALGLEDTDDRMATELAAVGSQARADKLKTYSVFFTDPRYAPQTDDGLPNAEAYLADAFAKANEITATQNKATDEYRRWDGKADAYVSVLTVMAMAFFLFGLAQALRGRMRLVFAVFGAVILLFSSAWAALVTLL
ncbi:hypothetical protein ANAEL_05585 [Anaerolineales bacterium]|nr:hypothetical protein ANAEL_05585 [Anaerolineales bacterium]